jgi:hypothetical protein
MVMKRYPNGAEGELMKRAPPGGRRGTSCARSKHGSGNVIDFPIVQDRCLSW